MKKLITVVAAAIVLGLTATSGAVAGSLITSADIKNHTIKQRDLAPGLKAKVNQPDITTTVAGQPGPVGPAGKNGVDGTDGKDGVSNLITGSGYHTTWKAGEFGETIETCPAGQYAIGGGYSTFGGYDTNAGYDLGGENLDIQVTVSAPYFAGEYVPVDEAGNFRADQWVVRGFNHGDTDQVVRAWVNCVTAR